MTRACVYCKRTEDHSLDEGKKFKVELRPYGPGGALVCFQCGTNPEHEKETDRQFSGRLAMAGRVVLLTDEGPAPGEKFIKDLTGETDDAG